MRLLYPGLNFGRKELSEAMRAAYNDIIEFVTTPEFRAVRDEMMGLPPEERPGFVTRVLMRTEELAARGIDVPDDILIQTSAFGDRRPTLFAVKKFLPERYHGAWDNVNLTFGNEFNEEDVPRDSEASWRPPLPVALQNALLASGVNPQTVPDAYGVNHGTFAPAHDRSLSEAER